MDDYEFVLKRLHGMNLKKISREVSIHYMTIYNIATRKTENPKFHTIQKLANYFRKEFP